MIKPPFDYPRLCYVNPRGRISRPSNSIRKYFQIAKYYKKYREAKIWAEEMSKHFSQWD